MPEVVSYIEQTATFSTEKEAGNDPAIVIKIQPAEQIINQDQASVPSLNNNAPSLKANILHHVAEVPKTYTYINQNGQKFSGTLTNTVEQCPVFKEMSAEHAQFVLDNPHIAERLAQRAREKRETRLKEDNIPTKVINSETAKADIKRAKQPQLVTESMLDQVAPISPMPLKREVVEKEPDIKVVRLAQVEIAPNEELARQHIESNKFIIDKSNIVYRSTLDSETEHILRQPEGQSSISYGAIHGDTVLANDVSETVTAAPASYQLLTLGPSATDNFELDFNVLNELEGLTSLTAEVFRNSIKKPEAALETVPTVSLTVLENSEGDDTTFQAEAMGQIEIKDDGSGIDEAIIELPTNEENKHLSMPEFIDMPFKEIGLDTVFDLTEAAFEVFDDEDESHARTELYRDIDTSSSDELYSENTVIAETTKALNYIPEWSAAIDPEEIEQLMSVLGRIKEVLDVDVSSGLEVSPTGKIFQQIIALNVSPENEGLIDTNTKVSHDRQEELFAALLIALEVPVKPQLIKSLISLSQRQYLVKLMPSSYLEQDYAVGRSQEIGTREFLQKMNHGLSIMKKIATHFYEIGKSTLLLYSLQTDTNLA